MNNDVEIGDTVEIFHGKVIGMVVGAQDDVVTVRWPDGWGETVIKRASLEESIRGSAPWLVAR